MANTLSLDVPVRGSADIADAGDPKATKLSDFAGTVDVDITATAEDDLEAELEAGEREGSEEPDNTADDAGDDEGAEAEEGSEDDLPDYDPDNEEVRSAYDAKFFTEDGTVNRDAISTAFWKAYDAAPEDKRSEVRLPDGVKKFLSDVTGFDAATIDDMTAAVRDHTFTQQREFKQRFGGEAIVEAALKWGAENYSETQRKRFAEAQSKGYNSEDAADQLEVLISRAARAGALKGIRRDASAGNPEQQSRRPRRPSSPKRNITATGQSQPSADVFKSPAEYTQAWSEALQSQDPGKIAYVRRKLRRSPAAQVSN